MLEGTYWLGVKYEVLEGTYRLGVKYSVGRNISARGEV